jgi:hypothetical protein
MASAARKVTSDHPTLARVVEQTVPLGFDMKEDEMKKIGMQMVLPYSKYRSELPDDVKKLLAKYNVDYDGGGKLLAGDDYDHFLYGLTGAGRGFGGIRDNTEGELVGYVTFKNVGHLPARKFCWVVKLDGGSIDWKPPKIKNRETHGESVIPLAQSGRYAVVQIPALKRYSRGCTCMSGAGQLTRTDLDCERHTSIFVTAIRGK